MSKELISKSLVCACAGIICTLLSSLANAEVLTLPLEQRPAWLKENGLIMAGSWEALPIRARIYDQNENYIPSEDKIRAYEYEHSPEMIAKLKELGVNFVMIHCYRGAGLKIEGQSMADAAKFAKRYHDADIRVGVYNYSGTIFWDKFFEEMPQSRQWMLLNKEGKPIIYHSTQPFRYYWDRNNPEAQDFYKKIVKFAVNDIQADLIHFDNYGPASGTDLNSLLRFRQYLKKTFTPEQLKSEGIKPDELNSVADLMDGSDPNTLLRRAWLDFTAQSVGDSYAAMTRYARSLRKDVLLELNGPRMWVNQPLLDPARILESGEACWDENESGKVGFIDGKLNTRIISYKYARTMDNMVFTYITTPLSAAESMAFNLDCFGCVCWYEYGKFITEPAAPKPLDINVVPYTKFYSKNREIYNNGKVVADVAVLRSYPSLSFGGPENWKKVSAVEQALIESTNCFEIINENRLKDLTKYPVLVLAGCTGLSDKHIEQIKKYVKSGGKLCIVGPVATHDEWYKARTGDVFAGLRKSNVITISQNDNVLESIKELLKNKLTLDIDYVAPEQGGTEAKKVCVGGKIFTDREYAITDMPEELKSKYTIPVSLGQMRENSQLSFQALVPGKIYAAFAPKGYSSGWVEPSSEWRLYKAAGLKNTISEFGNGMDIYVHEFKAGQIELFKGQQGCYAVLGIIPDDENEYSKVPFALNYAKKKTGICGEVIDQKNRRLLHLVNYYENKPVENVSVKMRIPKGRKVSAIKLMSPEHEPTNLPFERDGDLVKLTIKPLKTYEIVNVEFKN